MRSKDARGEGGRQLIKQEPEMLSARALFHCLPANKDLPSCLLGQNRTGRIDEEWSWGSQRKIEIRPFPSSIPIKSTRISHPSPTKETFSLSGRECDSFGDADDEPRWERKAAKTGRDPISSNNRICSCYCYCIPSSCSPILTTYPNNAPTTHAAAAHIPAS